MQSRVNLPWVDEDPDVFTTETYDIVKSKNSPSPPLSPLSLPDKNELRDSGHVEEELEEEEEDEEEDEEDSEDETLAGNVWSFDSLNISFLSLLCCLSQTSFLWPWHM